MNCIGTYDGTIFYNPANKFCIISVKTADQSVPAEARSNRRYKDHLIRFTAVGYEIPRTDAVELELDGEWAKGKYGVQLQVEQWREIVPRTKNGVEGYLASGLIKGIGPKTAADIVERFGVDTLDILEHQPERLLEIRGITENKLEDIKASYAENRMLQGIMTLLAPFKITPKTALKIYQYFGPTSVEILEKSPFELCQISGFGFRRVDAIVQKSGGDLHDPMRIKGAVFCALDEGKSKRGHLYISSEELEKSALKLLNEKIPVPELRLHQQEVRDMMQEMILNGAIVSVKDNIYLPRVFAQEDETARRIAQRLVTQMPVEHIAPVLEQVKVEMGLRLSAQQEAAVYAAFRHGLSVITGSPGTGKTTVLRTILEVYRRLHPDGKIALMAPTGRASRRMSESTGFEDARTLHSGLGLTSEEDEGSRNRKSEPLSADLIIVDEFSMVDMWLAEKFFERMKANARIVLVGDPDQLPSVGAGNVFREIIETQIVPVTVLDQIFRQSKDSLIAYNAKFINEGNTKLFYGPDFVFVSGDSQEDTAEKITERYCLEIQESGIENVQILSPFRSEGAASSEQLNETIRELVNPFRSAEEEIKFGPRIFRVNDRIMQTKNTEKVSNGDLGFIRYIKDTDQGKKIGMDFGAGRTLEYGVDDLSNVDLAYATTIHKAMGSEYETVIMPLLKAHTIMMYRNLLYTGITRAKKRVVLIGQKQVLFTRIHESSGKGENGENRIIKTLYCDNPDCETRRLKKFVHFVSQKAMDIEGLSEATLEKFIGQGFIHNYLDIYRLDRYRAEIVRMDGFGEKSWQRLWDAIQQSRNTTFERYLISMDIPMIGNTASKVLGRVFHYDLDEFRDAVYGGYDFRQLPDFGEILHNNIHDWFCVEDNFCIWEELQTMMSIQKPAVAEHSEDRVQDNPFVGKTIVVTGKVEPYTRDGINDLIESLGAHAGSSVSKKTDYLVCGENAGSKLSKARDLGVTVLSPAEFFSMAGAE